MRAFAGLNALGKLLVGFGVLLGIGAVALYAVVALGPSIGGFGSEEHRWDGGALLVELPKKETRALGCTVRPDQGEQRTVRAVRVNRRVSTEEALVEPWFAGAATVTCERVYGEHALVRTGFMASARVFFANTLYLLLIAAAAVVPVVVGLRVGRRR